MQPNEPAGQSDSLLAALYDGVTASEGFQGFITSLAASFELKAVTLITLHPATHDIKGLWLYGIEAQWLERYALHYASQDILAAHLMAAPIARFYASNLDLAADQLDLDSPFFREWLIPQGVAFAAGAILLQEGDWLSQIFVQRSPGQAPFERAELDQLNRLVPHLQRALQMRDRFAGLQLGEQMLTGWLDMLSMPTLLLDESGCVAYRNQRAAELLKNCAQLQVKDGHLLAVNQAESRQLNLAITKAIAAQWQLASVPSAVVQHQPPAAIAADGADHHDPARQYHTGWRDAVHLRPGAGAQRGPGRVAQIVSLQRSRSRACRRPVRRFQPGNHGDQTRGLDQHAENPAQEPVRQNRGQPPERPGRHAADQPRLFPDAGRRILSGPCLPLMASR